MFNQVSDDSETGLNIVECTLCSLGRVHGPLLGLRQLHPDSVSVQLLALLSKVIWLYSGKLLHTEVGKTDINSLKLISNLCSHSSWDRAALSQPQFWPRICFAWYVSCDLNHSWFRELFWLTSRRSNTEAKGWKCNHIGVSLIESHQYHKKESDHLWGFYLSK